MVLARGTGWWCRETWSVPGRKSSFYRERCRFTATTTAAVLHPRTGYVSPLRALHHEGLLFHCSPTQVQLRLRFMPATTLTVTTTTTTTSPPSLPPLPYHTEQLSCNLASPIYRSFHQMSVNVTEFKTFFVLDNCGECPFATSSYYH